MARRKKRTNSSTKAQPVQEVRRRWLSTSFAFLAGSGLLVALLTTAYQHYAGNVSLEFVQALGRGYEFQFKNDTPSDKLIKAFRVTLPSPQKFVYKISEDVQATVNESGLVTLPGGNVSYVPAAEFKELDGQKLGANSSLKFRIPPLSSRPWMQPEATIVDVRFELESTNNLLAQFDALLDKVGVRSLSRTTRYIVIENYWTASTEKSLNEAIRVFCRDNEAMSKSSTCTTER